jgi:hypothetical protein
VRGLDQLTWLLCEARPGLHQNRWQPGNDLRQCEKNKRPPDGIRSAGTIPLLLRHCIEQVRGAIAREESREFGPQRGGNMRIQSSRSSLCSGKQSLVFVLSIALLLTLGCSSATSQTATDQTPAQGVSDGTASGQTSAQDASDPTMCGDGQVMARFSACIQSSSEEACIAAGGAWHPIGLYPEPLCICPTGQDGCPCHTNADCLAGCVGPTDSTLDCSSLEVGVCSTAAPYVGCYCSLDDQGHFQAICAD